MTTLREAAQQALEALEKSRVFVTTREKIKHPEGTEWYDGTITALRAALAQQQEQEPVAWMVYTQDGKSVCVTDNPADFTDEHRALPLYTHPPRRETEQEADYPEEKLQAVAEYISDKYHVWYGVAARDIEEVLRQSARCGLVSGAPRREWVSLTEEEMHGLYRRAGLEAYYPRDGVVQYEYERRLDEYARAVEQACKERNT